MGVSKAEQIATCLKSGGFREQSQYERRTSKYRVFVADDRRGLEVNIYLGRNGAVRRGRTVGESRPFSDKAKDAILSGRVLTFRRCSDCDRTLLVWQDRLAEWAEKYGPGYVCTRCPTPPFIKSYLDKVIPNRKDAI